MDNLEGIIYKEKGNDVNRTASQRKRRFSEIAELESEKNSPDINNGVPAVKLRDIELQNESTLKDFYNKVDKVSEGLTAKHFVEVKSPNKPSLNNCCDEILIEIFQHLSTYDLFSIKKTCKRMERIACDQRLWQKVSVLNRSNTYDELLNILKHSEGKTKCFKLRGPDIPPTCEDIIENFTACLRDTTLTCHQLSVLELYAIQFDMKAFKITHIPPKLKCLVFSGCKVVNSMDHERPSWFHGIHSHLTCLEKLRIEYCTWFYPDDLMSISKLPELQTLSLRGCIRFFDIVAYGSISSLYGFKKLKSLDLRHVPMRDSDLQCFNAILSLREIILECHPCVNDVVPQHHTLLVADGNGAYVPIQCPPIVPLDNIRRFFTTAGGAATGASSNIIFVDLRNAMGRDNGAQDIGNDASAGSSGPRYINYPPTIRPNLLTNLGVCAFGSAPRQVHPHRIWISMRQRPKDTLIERFTVRNYTDITDEFLSHLVQCFPNIRYLNVSGTRITEKGIDDFKKIKPDCTVIAEHLH